MKLTPNRMTEEEADLEVKRRDLHWHDTYCPVYRDHSCCRPTCASYNDAYKKMTGSGHKDKKDWQVKDGYCSCVLVTGIIEHQGCCQ